MKVLITDGNVIDLACVNPRKLVVHEDTALPRQGRNLLGTMACYNHPFKNHYWRDQYGAIHAEVHSYLDKEYFAEAHFYSQTQNSWQYIRGERFPTWEQAKTWVMERIARLERLRMRVNMCAVEDGNLWQGRPEYANRLIAEIEGEPYTPPKIDTEQLIARVQQQHDEGRGAAAAMAKQSTKSEYEELPLFAGVAS